MTTDIRIAMAGDSNCASALLQAIEVAPEKLQADLRQAEGDVKGVLDRLSKPLPEDPETLAGALAELIAMRLGQQ